MKNKKIIIATLVAASALLTIIGTTYAFFTDNDSVKNTFSLGNIEIALDEPNWNNDNKGKGLLPGTTLLKDPVITQVKGSSYCRAVVEYLDESGNIITDKARDEVITNIIYYDTNYNQTTASTTNLIEGSTYTKTTLDNMNQEGKIYKTFNVEKFTLDEKRSTTGKKYYNCNDVLNEGEKLTLFTNIVVPTDYTNKENGLLSNFKIKVYAEAIQTTGFANAESAYQRLDKGVD